MKIFGERVKVSLKRLGKKQKELAELLEVRTSTLCEWLNGNNEPPMSEIVAISVALGVSCDYLLGVKDNP